MRARLSALFVLLALVALVTVACASTPTSAPEAGMPATEPPPPSPTVSTAEPLPAATEVAGAAAEPTDCLPTTATAQRLYNAAGRYCLVYPDEYKVEKPAENEIVLVFGGLLDAGSPRLHIRVSQAEGVTAESAADRVAADFADFELMRSATTVAGEPAVVLDKVPGQDLNRRILFVHDGLLYDLMLAPADEALGDVYARMEALQAQVLGSFSFLAPDAPPASDCLAPTRGAQLFDDASRGFCLLYPDGFTAETPAADRALFYAGSLQDVNAPRLFIEIGDAGGRTASELADAAVAELADASPSIPIDRTFGVTLGYQPVERLDGMPGQDINRQLIAVWGDRVYRLIFMPADPELGEPYRQMEALYDLVVKSFRFLGDGAAFAAPEQPVTVPLPPTPEPRAEVRLTSYRDEVGGWEIDFPEGWSLVDAAADVKQNAQGYSITLSSWQPRDAGGQGIPEGGTKLDIGVSRGAAETPDQAIESQRLEIVSGDAGARIVFEEPWELEGGLVALRWTLQPSDGSPVYEVVTAIAGNRIVVSGTGDPVAFDAIAITLRPAATVALAVGAEVPAGAGAESAEGAAAAEHIVVAGDTLTAIAARYGVTIQALLEANPTITNPDRIYVGQRLAIPSLPSPPAPAPRRTTRVSIYMVSIGDGNIGCGDGIVAVRRDLPWTPAPLSAALNLLLAQHTPYYGQSGLYNALHQSSLRIERITRLGSAWTIELSGNVVLGGSCDAPRVKAQLEQTALQFSTVGSVRYLVNGRTLEEVLSSR